MIKNNIARVATEYVINAPIIGHESVFVAEQSYIQKIAIAAAWIKHPSQGIDQAVAGEISVENLYRLIHMFTMPLARPCQDGIVGRNPRSVARNLLRC
ncbi:hypothetical protein PG2T_02740 [Immundisolibacter cernigliae]|uniref:Uncharacterized protein n=1 Tax=Immundisolibacter cernigliae TaxID=1810504 RepID=A0A1B1YR24_9GAMM|nr:hypothetical protein PG2T_02740 [Immundisolibacter cernigliae]